MAAPSPLKAAGPEAFPQRLEPMLATMASEPFDSPEKIFEVKWDGIRTLAFISGGQVRLQSRSLQDITQPFADVAAGLARAVRADGVVLDGELVSLNKEGLPRLPLVMQRLQRQGAGQKTAVSYELFDIVYRGYRPLLGEPLWRRKGHLNQTVRPSATVHLCHFEEGLGVAFYQAVTALGLEGMVAKDKHSFYYPGKRSRHWLKVKVSRTANLVVGGYSFGGGQRKELFGGLLLGAYEGKALRFLGSVGGGFGADDLKSAYSILSQLHTPVCPFAEPPAVPRFLYWCEPRLVVQVKYGELTEGGHLRFPIFTAFRPDVDPGQCTLAALRGG
ncbi:MAG: hypothetical protein HY330_06025 [Chloroflexi bacterium]|nr:hypothetical protein [Chloroflexota bacterium]